MHQLPVFHQPACLRECVHRISTGTYYGLCDITQKLPEVPNSCPTYQQDYKQSNKLHSAMQDNENTVAAFSNTALLFPCQCFTALLTYSMPKLTGWSDSPRLDLHNSLHLCLHQNGHWSKGICKQHTHPIAQAKKVPVEHSQSHQLLPNGLQEINILQI